MPTPGSGDGCRANLARGRSLLTDENATDIDFQKQTDLVGITAMTITAQRAYEIADTYRARGVKVILGGSHPSALPQEASQHADAVVIGEAEGIWSNVIH